MLPPTPLHVDYTLPFAVGLLLAVSATLVLLALTAAQGVLRLLRRKWRPRRGIRLAALAVLVLGVGASFATTRIKGATMEHAAVDLAMIQAPRPPAAWRASVVPPAPYLLLAGDLHCHINPPDWSDHVARHLPETLQLAKDEGLDFISLVPHVFSDLYRDRDTPLRIAGALADLQARIDARPADGLILDVGVEYIDPTGHVGMVFGDVRAALLATPYDVAVARPSAFIEAFADKGGILVVNHPLLTPIHSWAPMASLDISWQPFTGRPPFRQEIAAVDARAETFEAANLFVSAVRDRFLLGDSEDSTRRVLGRLDHEILARRRRMTPVGGTDSHSFYLRPMTFVLATARSREAIRDAIQAGRTCVAQPGACTLEVRPEGTEAFSPVGSSLQATTRVEARASGHSVVIYRDGERVATPTSGQVVSIAVVPGQCSVLRATVDGGYSAPVYVNCPFATKGP
ncbi:MAG: hypothetical protein ABJE95_31250 [Byssovorax sp.]